jgi:hypothetical protein
LKLGNDIEENAVQESSSLNAFTWINAPSILEVTNSLKTTKNIVVELETEMKYIKDKITIDV